MIGLLAGGTGLIGRELAALWPQTRPGPGTLHLLLRKPGPTPARHERQHVVDFGALPALTALPALPPADEAFCCLGTTIAVAGSQAAFRAVDHGAVLAFAKAAQAVGVQRFAVVSALGADVGARSFYTRVKGEMERDLQALNFKSLVIARPSLLAGNRAALQQAPRLGERLALALSAPLSPWIPLAWRPIAASSVARAMLRAQLRALGPGAPRLQILESKDLQVLGAPDQS